MTFTITLSEPAGVPVTVNYVTADVSGGATAGTDYTAVATGDNATATITASTNTTTNTTGTFDIDITGDADAEADETFEVTISSPVNATLVSPDTATGTILSDDATALTIESISVAENVGTANVRVSLASPGATAITVPFTITDGTAAADSEFTAPVATELVFFGRDADGYQVGADGNRVNDGTSDVLFTNADKVMTIDIPILDDNVDEDDKSFTIQLGDVANVEELNNGLATITIVDNEAQPTVTIASVTAQNEPSDTPPVTDATYDITVSLSHASEKGVTVGYTVSAGTAVATHDYVLNNTDTSTLTFDSSTTTQNISLTIKADNIDEEDETFSVDLTTVNNAQFGAGADNPQTVTINDNDDAPVISINSVTVTEGTDAGGIFTLTQTPNSGKSVEVTVTYADGSATEGTSEDYQITTTGFTSNSRTFVFDPSNEPAANATIPITFTISDDALDEDAETFTVTLSNPASSTNFSLDTTNNTHIGTATINDNDDEPTLSMANDEQTEGTALTFTPTLSTASGRDVVVTYYTEGSGSFPVSADDYTAVPQEDTGNSIDATTITIPAGSTTPTPAISIASAQDTNPEPDETFTLHYEATNVSAETATGSAIGTIESDDPRTIAITRRVSIAENSSDDAVLDVIVSPAPDADSGDITVTYTLSDTSAGAADYSHTPVALVFTVGGNGKATISIDITDDMINEGNETITVQLANADSINLFGGGTSTITILDNDTTLPEVGFVLANKTVTEGTGAMNDPILVQLTDASGNQIQSGRTVTVLYAFTEGTAKDSEDFKRSTGATGTLTFDPGTMSEPIPVDVIADVYDEVNEMFTIRLSGPSEATLRAGFESSEITITDNDDAPEVSIATTKSVPETDAELDDSITVTLSEASGKTVTVPYTVTAGTATTADFTLASGSLVFTPGDTTTITTTTDDIDFKIIGDTLDEDPESFTITLGGSTLANATLKAGEITGTVTITDNDPEPTLTMANATEDEGTNLEFTPTLDTASGRNVVVTYYTLPSGSFPVDADDYTAVPQEDTAAGTPASTVTILAGQTTPIDNVDSSVDPIEIVSAVDGNPEPDETFTLHYSATNVSTETASGMATGTIVNEDPQTIAINSISIGEDAGTVTLDVILSPAPAAGSPVDVTYTVSGTADGTDSATKDYTHTTGTLNFTNTDNEETISFTIENDEINEDNETIIVSLDDVPGINEFGTGVGTITILDNDGTLPTVGFESPTTATAEGASANADPNILVKLTDGSGNSVVSGRTVTVVFALNEDSAKDPEDFVLETGASNTITFNPGESEKKVPIEIVHDVYNEASESFSITLSSPNNATLGDATNTVTIADNDAQPVASITSEVIVTEADVNEDGTIAVTIDPASGQEVTVPYTVTTGTATSADFTLAEGDVTFTPDSTTGISPTSQNITFNITGDDLDENEEQFTITLGASPTNATRSTTANVGTVKITDNDDQPTLTIDNAAEPEGTTIAFTPTLNEVSGRDVIVTYYTSEGGNFPASSGDYDEVAMEDQSNSIDATTINYSRRSNDSDKCR